MHARASAMRLRDAQGPKLHPAPIPEESYFCSSSLLRGAGQAGCALRRSAVAAAQPASPRSSVAITPNHRVLMPPALGKRSRARQREAGAATWLCNGRSTRLASRRLSSMLVANSSSSQGRAHGGSAAGCRGVEVSRCLRSRGVKGHTCERER